MCVDKYDCTVHVMYGHHDNEIHALRNDNEMCPQATCVLIMMSIEALIDIHNVIKIQPLVSNIYQKL